MSNNYSNYDIHTYRSLLISLEKIERDENDLRKRKSVYVVFGSSFGIVLSILLATMFHAFFKIGFLELITSYGAAMTLGPVFGFVYYSTQADSLADRKIKFCQSLQRLFSTENISIDNSSTDSLLDIDEIKKMLMEKLKEKLNENITYEH